MNVSKALTTSAIAFLLVGCSPSQSQNEGAAPAMAATGSKHIHNVEGHGDFTHSHKGNSTAKHTHSWAEIQKQIKGQ